jgi:hypothetical protein
VVDSAGSRRTCIGLTRVDSTSIGLARVDSTSIGLARVDSTSILGACVRSREPGVIFDDDSAVGQALDLITASDEERRGQEEELWAKRGQSSHEGSHPRALDCAEVWDPPRTLSLQGGSSQ